MKWFLPVLFNMVRHKIKVENSWENLEKLQKIELINFLKYLEKKFSWIENNISSFDIDTGLSILNQVYLRIKDIDEFSINTFREIVIAATIVSFKLNMDTPYHTSKFILFYKEPNQLLLDHQTKIFNNHLKKIESDHLRYLNFDDLRPDAGSLYNLLKSYGNSKTLSDIFDESSSYEINEEDDSTRFFHKKTLHRLKLKSIFQPIKFINEEETTTITITNEFKNSTTHKAMH